MRGIGIALAVAAFTFGAASANAAGIKQYKTEAGAQKHCPSDTVVWGSSESGVYHMSGSKNYGKSKGGKYVCMGEADKAGWHASKNKQ
jgi:hypothetical protein